LPPEIRQATSADAETIAAILIECKETSLPRLITDHDRDKVFWQNRWRKYLSEGSSAQMSRGDGFGLMAEQDGIPVGFAAWHHTTRHGADAELESLYVLPAAQRRGLGTTLLRTVVERLIASGDRSMCVGYDPRNPYKRFYLERGAAEINPHWALWRDIRNLSI
jgi:GNAT superfamily N-acetyltransferase